MFCSKCGAEIPDDSVFCPKCGNNLSVDVNVAEINQNTGNEQVVRETINNIGVQSADSNIDGNNQLDEAKVDEVNQNTENEQVVQENINNTFTQPVESNINHSSNKKAVIIGIVVVVIGIAAIIGTFLYISNKSSKSKTDIAASDDRQAQEKINYVREGSPVLIPDITYGDAYTYFFTDPKWDYFISNDGKEIVEFEGGVLYLGQPATAYNQFVLGSDLSFELSDVQIKVNGEAQPITNSAYIEMCYRPFEVYSQDVLGKELDEDVKESFEEAYIQLASDVLDSIDLSDDESVEIPEESSNAYTEQAGPLISESSSYILPESDTRLYSESELMGLTPDELRLARNEILARHGRLFNDESLQAYFNSMPWYTGSISPEEFDSQMSSILNKYETANIDVIKDLENRAISLDQELTDADYAILESWCYGYAGSYSMDGTDLTMSLYSSPESTEIGTFSLTSITSGKVFYMGAEHSNNLMLISDDEAFVFYLARDPSESGGTPGSTHLLLYDGDGNELGWLTMIEHYLS